MPSKFVWLNGQMVPWSDATVHVTTLGWSTMPGVFEGIKAYWNAEERQLYAYQFAQHFERFADSMRLQYMHPAWSPEELAQAALDLLQANDAREDSMIRPIAYLGDVSTFGAHADSRTHVLIWTLPFKSALGTGRTFRVGVSSWTRMSDNMLPPRVKCFSNYQNSRLALLEAQRHGYDSAILLNDHGKVAEGPAACLILIRDGVAITPSVTSGILESVTRATILRLCREMLNIPTLEREVDRTELYVADELFFCGTGAEITPISEVDGHKVGEGAPGPITSRIEAAFHDIVRGRNAHYQAYATGVYPTAQPALAR